MRIALFFSHKFSDLHAEVKSGLSPKERAYGVHELECNGHSVKIRDQRFTGGLGKTIQKLKHKGFNFVTPSDIGAVFRSDLIYVKDNFSTLLTLAALIARKPIIYCDSIFFISKNPIKKFLLWVNLLFCTRIIAYSNSQKELWIKEFGNVCNKIHIVNYVIDSDFYLKHATPKNTLDKKFFHILSVGRDPGREYRSLVSASAAIKEFATLTVVVPHYLIKNIDAEQTHIQQYENLSYEKLFEIYANSDVACVPIKQKIDYPSGIRAILEAMTLGLPVIAAKTDFLGEIFTDKENIVFVEAESVASLIEAINWSRNNPDLLANIARNGNLLVREKFEYNREMKKLIDLITDEKQSIK